MKKAAFLFWISILTSSLSAQDASTDFTNLNQLFPALPASAVHCIYEDDRGLMWFGTNEGLYSFDGLSVNHFRYNPLDTNSLSGTFVYRILQDNTGLYWIGTKNGLTTYDPHQPAGKEFRRLVNKPGYPKNRVYDLVKDKEGRLWGSTRSEKGFCIDPVTGIIRDVPGISGRIFFDKKQNLLYCGKEYAGFATIDPETGIYASWKCRLDSAYFHYMGAYDSLLLYILPFVDSQGNVWSGFNGKYYRFDPNKGKLKVFYSHTEGDQAVRVMTESEDGSIWFGTLGNGLFRFDPSTEDIVRYGSIKNSNTGIPSNIITALFTDSKGTVWIGTSRGICLYSKKIQAFHSENPLEKLGDPNNTNEFSSYLNTAGGVELFGAGVIIIKERSGAKPKLLPISETKNKSGAVFQFVEGESPGEFWLGADYFLWRLKDNQLIAPPFICDSITKRKTLDADVTKIVKDTVEGELVLWIGTNCENTYVYNTHSTVLQCFTVGAGNPEDFPFKCTYDIEKDNKGQIWFATYGGGLVRLEDKHQLKFKTWNRANSAISSDIVSDIQFDRRGNLWIVTELSVDIFDGKSFRSAAPYLPLNTGQIINVTDDLAGNIWFATNRELIRLNPDDYTSAVFSYHRNFRDIIQWNTTLLLKKPDGTIAIPGNDGIIFFNPLHAGKQITPSKTVLTGFNIHERPFNNLLYLPEISLSYDQNFLTFNFACLNYINSALNHFSWKLEGADKDWVTPTDNRNFASYSTLPPGGYTFIVKSCNADGIWDEKGASIRIIIHPPWWKTWWFRSMVLMAISLGIYWLFTMRTDRITERQQAEFNKKLALEHERNRIARDIHDDISSGLSAINLLANYIRQNPENADMHKEILRITESSRDINQRLREIIWSVNSESDNLDSLINFLRRYLMDFGEMHHLEVQFDAPDSLPVKQLSGEVRQNLFLCFKEVLNNSAKHAEATQVQVNISLNALHELIIEIKDNGKGFDFEEALQKGGNGLRNLKKRMDMVGGGVRFENSEGSRVLLSYRLL